MTRGESQSSAAMARQNSQPAGLPHRRSRSAAFGDGNNRLDACSSSRAGVHIERATQDTHALGNVFQPEASIGSLPCWGIGESAAVIFDPKPHIVHVPFQYDARSFGLGMFQNVVHGFLNDAI